jgi:hypothetical protein
VPAVAPRPDISTEEALRRAVQAAPGMPVGSLLARREAELGREPA